jgi:hypothetical protein
LYFSGKKQVRAKAWVEIVQTVENYLTFWDHKSNNKDTLVQLSGMHVDQSRQR